MHSSTLLISSFLFTIIAAAPVGGTDQCGPAVQIPSDLKDTCTTVPTASIVPAAYGINFIDPPQDTAQLPNGAYDACAQATPLLCQKLVQIVDLTAWTFMHVDQGYRCELGFYLPAEPNVTGAAKLSPEQCTRIFTTMRDEATRNSIAIGATINLKKNPAMQPAQTLPLLPRGNGTGQAVNAGYHSYVLQVSQLDGQIQAPSMVAAPLTRGKMARSSLRLPDGQLVPCTPDPNQPVVPNA
ncbi:MAG: hypothetical protein Q9218_004680 [Villophora microphyllina]